MRGVICYDGWTDVSHNCISFKLIFILKDPDSIMSFYLTRELWLRNQAMRASLLADAVAIHESAHP